MEVSGKKILCFPNKEIKNYLANLISIVCYIHHEGLLIIMNAVS